MKRSTLFLLPLFVFATSEASAQSSVAAQSPAPGRAGSFEIIPSLGVIHQSSLTDLAIVGRGRYHISEELAVTGRIGGALGDLDLFQIGADARYTFVKAPVEVAAFAAADLALGDATIFTLMGGPLVGKTVDVAKGLTPYGGLGLGVAHTKFTFVSTTEIMFGVVLGAQMGFTETFSAFTELTIGVTDGLATINWHFGVPISLG